MNKDKCMNMVQEIMTKYHAVDTQLLHPLNIYNWLIKQDSYLQANLDRENLWVISLNRRNQPIGINLLYTGTIYASQIRLAEVFRPAIINDACHIAVVHNHPSGVTTPSPDDMKITKGLIKVGDLLDIPLLDSIIVGVGYTSIKEVNGGFWLLR